MLSDREAVLVWAWSLGRDLSWVARREGLSLTTVNDCSIALRRRLGARSKTEVVAIVMRALLAPPAVEPEGVSCVVGSSPVLRLARMARAAVRDGVDPELALSFVIWPTERLERLAA